MNIAYLIGGYTKAARFVDLDGYVLNTGQTGKATQWNLAFGANGTAEGFANYLPTAMARTPLDFEMFSHRVTGAVKQDAGHPLSQDNRAGIEGTWSEVGVRCEACHGPGSLHAPSPGARRMFVDTSNTQTCGACHVRPFGDTTGKILVQDGYILDQQQASELKASGGHKGFACTYCHDPHKSVTIDKGNAIRNACNACHGGQNMALHEGKVFTRDGYTESLTCESCHLPPASKAFHNAVPPRVTADGRQGDTRTHIFRINTTVATSAGLFSDDGTEVRKDAQGRAAVTVDFVCLRCHAGGGLFNLTPARALEIAPNLHKNFSLRSK